MLKLIYTETSLHLELLDDNLANWIERRLLFATSVGQQNFVARERATFLLPEPICHLAQINALIYHEGATAITVCRGDIDRVEVILSGYWLSSQQEQIEGVFVTQLPALVECYLWERWHRTHDRSIASNEMLG